MYAPAETSGYLGGQRTEESHHNRRHGRTPVVATPDIEPGPEWAQAWIGYEVERGALGRWDNTIRNRRTAVSALSRHATAEGLSPGEVSKQWLQGYLIEQRSARRGNGYTTHFEDLRQFWIWWSDEYGLTSPMANISRPKTVETDVPILTPGSSRPSWRCARAPAGRRCATARCCSCWWTAACGAPRCRRSTGMTGT